MNSSNIFDAAVLITLIYCAWKGASKGLVAQAAWVVALILCFKFAGELAPAVEPVIAVDQPLRKWIAMAIVYLGLCLVSFVAAGMLTTWLEKMKLKDFDRHLGALLGFLKGVVICMTVMFFALTLSQSLRPIVSETKSAYVAAMLLHHIDPLIPLIPEGASDTVKGIVERFNHELGNAEKPTGGAELDAKPFDDGWENTSGSPGIKEPGGFSWPDLLSGNTSTTNNGSNPNTADPSLSDLLSRLPASVRDDLTSKAMEALRNSTPEEKQQLLRQLGSNIPENAGSVLDSFVKAVSGQGSNAAGETTPASLNRSDSALLDQIAGIYGDRRTIVSRTKEYLAGVPPTVQRLVLEDWHADVMLLQNDPDPGTDVNSRIDERILRQLSRAGISLDRLDRNLATRLSQSIR